jgi:predicted nucleic acid-binding protein
MKIGYVDTSALLAVAFDEPAGKPIAGRLRTFSRLISSNLLEAEFRSALAREELDGEHDLLDAIDWILPDRPLTGEFRKVLRTGYVRGADLWHLACALFIDPGARGLSFITVDGTQKALARRIGFTV